MTEKLAQSQNAKIKRMFLQLLLLLLFSIAISSENFGHSPPYAFIAGIGPEREASWEVVIEENKCKQGTT